MPGRLASLRMDDRDGSAHLTRRRGIFILPSMNETASTWHELLGSLESLERELHCFERKFGLASGDFHRLYEQGRLDDSDFEQTVEFGTWAAAYRAWLERQDAVRQLSHRRTEQLAEQRLEPISLA